MITGQDEETVEKWEEYQRHPSTIPDAVLKAERARRNAAKRKTFGPREQEGPAAKSRAAAAG